MYTDKGVIQIMWDVCKTQNFRLHQASDADINFAGMDRELYQAVKRTRFTKAASYFGITTTGAPFALTDPGHPLKNLLLAILISKPLNELAFIFSGFQGRPLESASAEEGGVNNDYGIIFCF